ncbi:hypothetical protein [Actinoplanes sp. DH11]|uniref:hypothetical protein n=1 Tax=Actinoplanes sp. DH11 TaxID=2857011 RepID=UPI001E312A7F|nr:hypothetical protein [Actinoplanes sp. DH11]
MRLLFVPLCLVALVGCAPADDPAAAETASAFLRAVADRDGAAACDALAPAVRDKMGETCAEDILNASLPAPSPVTDTQVYGQRALVRLGTESVFLGMFPGGWRVVAAGCTARGDRPYDCAVTD